MDFISIKAPLLKKTSLVKQKRKKVKFVKIARQGRYYMFCGIKYSNSIMKICEKNQEKVDQVIIKVNWEG